MSGGGETKTETVQQVAAPTNPALTTTQNKVLGLINTAADAGPSTPGYSTFSPAGATTQGAWAQSLGAAGNSDYASSIQQAIKSFGGTAAGNDFGTNAPGYATLRANAGDDALKSVNAVFNNSGRLGGGSNVQAAGTGVTNALAGLDYTNYQNDIARQQAAVPILQQLFGAAQLPSATQGAVGSAMDANQQGILSGQYDLDTRNANALTDLIAKLSGSYGGSASGSGTTSTQTTTTPTTPWWESALSLGGSLL